MSIECEVWWAKPVAADKARLALLDPLERGRFDTYRREADQQRFLTGRVLAKSVVAAMFGEDPGAITFDATCADCGKPHGRPTLPGSTLELSLTHSGDRIGLALATGVPIGLDVEVTKDRSTDNLISYALTDAERAVLEPLPAEERHQQFFVYWARKEALMKATGLGLKVPLRAMSLSSPGEPPALVSSEHPALRPDQARIADLDAGPGYRAALAVLTAEPIEVTERWWQG